MVMPNVTVDYREFQINERINQALRNRIQNGLLVGATIVEDAAKRLAPRHVGDFIHHTSVYAVNDTTYRVDVFVRIKDAPDAAAWEYGSGLHRTRSTPGTYSIDAKGHGPYLVFFWEKMNRMFIGPHVNHPGIVARPYLHPALQSSISRILREISRKTP